MSDYSLEYAISRPNRANVLFSRDRPLRYGDEVVMEMRIGGSTVQPGKPISWFGETARSKDYLKFRVVSPRGERCVRELNQRDEFMLVDEAGQRVVTVEDTGVVSLKPIKHTSRPQSRLSAYDRSNVKGGLTSRVTPIEGINFLYSYNVSNALVWVWRNNQVIAMPYSYFSRDNELFLQGGICGQHNLVQVIIHIV